MVAALAFATEQFDRIAERIPDGQIIASNGIDRWTDLRRPSLTSDYPLVGLNRNGWTNVINVDIDADWTPDGASESFLRCLDAWAKPNLVMVNPANGHAHATFFLGRPAYTRSENPKMAKLVADLGRRLRHSLGGDGSYSNGLLKNPLCSRWNTYLLRSDLYEFDEILELPAPPQVKAVANGSEAALIGRNCHLFDMVRHIAYRNPAEAAEFSVVFEWVLDLNSSLYADNPLDYPECRHLAKSIARFMREDWQGGDRPHRPHLWEGRKPVMTFDDESPTERKQAGARYVHAIRHSSTSEAIREARVRLGHDGTQKRVASLTGFSMSTVKRYWNETPVHVPDGNDFLSNQELK